MGASTPSTKPYLDPKKPIDPVPVFHHVCVYAYRPAALQAYNTKPVRALEALKGLKQFRFLENGIDVQCVEVKAHGRVFWELKNPEDIPHIESALKEMN